MIDRANENPMGLDGFEFVEFATLDPVKLGAQFESLGFVKVAENRFKKAWLYRQGFINFIINAEPGSQAEQFAKLHGPAACAMGFRVKNSAAALKRALKHGATRFDDPCPTQEGELAPLAIMGIGGSVIYFIDQYANDELYQHNYQWLSGVPKHPAGTGLLYIDHLTHNVLRGHMDKWAGFYSKIFNFREIRYFDIKGQQTGLISRAMSSPCNKIRIPLNESKDDKSQIEEFIHELKGEGIQHIALGTDNIYQSVEALRQKQVAFMDVPDTYYEMLDERLPQHGEDLARLHKNYIIIDGNTREQEHKLLLQIFTKNMLGPLFFEIIQRKGDEGFGEGNFQALFESIERDQIRRGIIQGKL